MVEASPAQQCLEETGDDVLVESPGEERKVPGEVGIWVLIFGDMAVFAAFFAVFMHARGGDPGLFDESRHLLNVTYAVVNTVLLLTSSLFVAMAVRAVRIGRRHLAPRLLIVAIICGLGFVVNKAIEYHDKFDHGITPTTNLFFTYFFTLTGIHLLHLIIGLVALGVMWIIARRTEEQRKSSDVMMLEVGASFWHMVDLLWIVLFPLLYLVR
jgi:nitric oxide reductase NorE protein